VAPGQANERVWGERGAAKLAAARERLAVEVAALRSGEDWRRFLDFQAKLHAYSASNSTLIGLQHAEAFERGLVGSVDPGYAAPGYAAGFVTWRAFGRRVDRGQHGCMILASCRVDRRVALDADGNARRLGRGEMPGEWGWVESRRVVSGFRVEHVFSVQQTSGIALPERPRPRLLAGEAPRGLGAAVLELIESRGFSVDTVADADAIGGANGVTAWDTRAVVVRADMVDAAMVKTLIHEAGHVLGHGEAAGWLLPRPLGEVEAESVAFVVASVDGMATDGYSFPYVAAWVGEDGPRAVLATQARVAQVARTIIDASPAPRLAGGRPPGADAAIVAARTANAPSGRRRSPRAPGPAAEPVGVGR